MYSDPMLMSSGVAMTRNWKACSLPNVSYDQRRTERMTLTAPMPVLAIRI
jgi:hypothetical protein